MSQNMNDRDGSSLNSPSKTGDLDMDNPQEGCHAVTLRLKNELKTLMMNCPKGVSAFPDGDSLFNWIGTIEGPTGTVFEGMKFKLTINFQSGYPFKPPAVKFTTPCFHPNVDLSGNICIDILKDKWSALYTISTILLSLQSLLGEPNNESPLNAQAATMWENQEQYRKYMLQSFNTEK